MRMGKKIRGEGIYDRNTYLLGRCEGKRVLHVGCSDYPYFDSSIIRGGFLHEKLTKVAKECVGIDVAENEIQKMKVMGYDVRQVDAQNMGPLYREERFDVVLLCDIIEHVSNPGLVLVEARKVLRKSGRVVVTVPNAFGIVRFLKAFLKYEQVHPDHVAYYSSGTLETLAKKHDLVVEKSGWYMFELAEKRPAVILSVLAERIVTLLCPWFGEGCIAEMRIISE